MWGCNILTKDVQQQSDKLENLKVKERVLFLTVVLLISTIDVALPGSNIFPVLQNILLN
jgi:hypothetical protein